MADPDRARIGRRLRRQADACRRLESPLYAALLAHAAADVERGGPAWRVLRGHESDRPGSALGLRLMGAVHRLVLEGKAPELARYYPSAGGEPRAEEAAGTFLDVLDDHTQDLFELVERPVQTNEVGRSTALLGGFLIFAHETGLPLRLLELGASAGLNLRWDRYHYDFGLGQWGERGSTVKLRAELTGEAPTLTGEVEIVARAGCDSAPVDPTTEPGRLTLLSYVWSDQIERIRRLEAAIAIARAVPAPVDQADAGEWLESRLRPPRTGAATVVFHSIVMQYVEDASRRRVDDALEEAGKKASPTAPLARLAMEPAGEETEIRLTTWPGGYERLLGRAAYHGSRLTWLTN